MRHTALIWPIALVACSSTSSGPPATRQEARDASDSAAPSSESDASNDGSKLGTEAGREMGRDAAIDGASVFPVDANASETGISTDAADDTGATSADGGTVCTGLFCEDFETGRIDPTKWDLVQGAGGTAVVQQQVVAHGKYAMQVHGLASVSDYALIVTKSAPPGLRGTHYGRAYYLITPKPLTSGHTQMVFAGTNGTGAANGPGPFTKLRYMEVANINGGWQIGFDLLDIAPLVEEVAYPSGSPQVPTMLWTCLEWQFSDQPDAVNLWVDGMFIGVFDDQHVSFPGGHTPGTPLYNGKSSGLIGEYTLFGFGFHDWHPNKAFDIYYDDIVLDTKRVGCLPR